MAYDRYGCALPACFRAFLTKLLTVSLKVAPLLFQ
jgi:hypothetical protein